MLLFLKGQVRAEWVEWGHVAAENTGEHRRMLGMEFYVTATNCGKGRVREHNSGWCVGNNGKMRVVYSGRRREEGNDGYGKDNAMVKDKGKGQR